MTRSMTTPTGRSSAATWVMLLAGPVIWYVYFWLVYLLAEGVCRVGGLDFEFMGMTGLSFVTIAVTAGASTLTVISALRSYSSWRKGPRDGSGYLGMAFAGLVLSGIFLLAVLATGLPALVLRPC
jgi:hypothetical protein